MGIFTLSALLVAGAGFYLFAQSFPNFKPGGKKIETDLNAMRQEVLQQLPDLVPLNMEEVEQLSSREINKVLKKGFVVNHKGVFTTIFDEPAVAFYRRNYLSNARDVLIYAKTRRHEFSFWIRGEEAQFSIDGQLLGTYRDQTGVLIGSRSQKMVAQLDKTKDPMPLSIQGRNVGNLSRQRSSTKDILSQRIFDFVKNDLSAEELAILLAVGIYEMLERRDNERS